MPAAEHAAVRAALSVSYPGQLVLGAAVGVIATALALGGHAISGGATPGLGVLAALTLAAVVACAVLGRTRWRLPSLFGVLVVMQVAFHVAFGSQAGPSMHAGQGHGHGHSLAGQSATTGLGWQMLVAHVVAVLMTALVIRRGAQICRLLAAVLARPLGIIRVLLSPAPSPPATSAFGRETRRASKLPQLVLCAAPRRGPPALLAT